MAGFSSVQRQLEETKRISKDVEDTKTTVMLPSVNGGLAPAMKMEERRTLGANNTVESQKSTLFLDGAGNWQVNEVRKATTRQEGKNLSTEERVSRLDSEGKRRSLPYCEPGIRRRFRRKAQHGRDLFP